MREYQLNYLIDHFDFCTTRSLPIRDFLLTDMILIYKIFFSLNSLILTLEEKFLLYYKL